MIQSFRHKGLERFFETGNLKGIQPNHHKRLRLLLAALNTAFGPEDMELPGFSLHELKGDRKGTWSISVSGNWRLTFKFVGIDVELVDYEDYH